MWESPTRMEREGVQEVGDLYHHGLCSVFFGGFWGILGHFGVILGHFEPFLGGLPGLLFAELATWPKKAQNGPKRGPHGRNGGAGCAVS